MTCFSLLLAAALLLPAPGHAARIKFATLAPEGTDAMKALQALDAEVRKATADKVQFKFYAGGRQGDEKDIVRKIRAGQLHAGGFTGVGLGEIAPEVRVLDAPWLFKSPAEVDFIYETFSKDFEKSFEAKGYILLGWSEVGFVHVFSNAPVTAAEDLKKLKIWVWEGDPIAESAFAALGVHPIPLSVTDVNTSLQTGLIDSVYSSPLYAIALQWHEKTKYVFSMPVANASGAVLMSKKEFDAMPADEQAALLRISRARLKELNAKIRVENEKSFATLKAQGLKLTDPKGDAQRVVFEEAGKKARRALVGRLYSQELLDKVEKSLADFRLKQGAKK